MLGSQYSQRLILIGDCAWALVSRLRGSNEGLGAGTCAAGSTQQRGVPSKPWVVVLQATGPAAPAPVGSAKWKDL